jgi:hypothetical protein
MKDTNKTKVIFRKFKDDGQIIAIFPEELGTYSPYTSSSYMSIGQHSSCDPVSLISVTKLAKKSEYKDLARELTNLGYNLQIITRYRHSFLEVRRKELNRINNKS